MFLHLENEASATNLLVTPTVRQTAPAAKNRRKNTGCKQQRLQGEFSKGKSYLQESQIHIHSDGPHTEHCYPW